MNITQWKQRLESEAGAALLTRLYGAEAVAAQTERYETLLDQFASDFGDQDVSMFTSPGRSEIGGNHTDHNNGRVLAASINLDCVGAGDRLYLLNECTGNWYNIDKAREPIGYYTEELSVPPVVGSK